MLVDLLQMIRRDILIQRAIHVSIYATEVQAGITAR